ncbi:hypothetical protein [Pseudoalteromonas sp. '520P1 No. 423']|uniref:hypothetical protein n=1 Tax=unclassified Pseudoalteromonas TaxID=194690 RepID=UPI000ACAFD29
MNNNSFMMGQFSLIDAILDKSMEDALIGKSNILFHVLEVEKSYEKASWWAMKPFL